MENIINFYGRYKTADNRLLYGFIGDTGSFIIKLGNTGFFKFNSEQKAEKKMNYFIKELNAIEL